MRGHNIQMSIIILLIITGAFQLAWLFTYQQIYSEAIFIFLILALLTTFSSLFLLDSIKNFLIRIMYGIAFELVAFILLLQ